MQHLGQHGDEKAVCRNSLLPAELLHSPARHREANPLAAASRAGMLLGNRIEDRLRPLYQLIEIRFRLGKTGRFLPFLIEKSIIVCTEGLRRQRSAGISSGQSLLQYAQGTAIIDDVVYIDEKIGMLRSRIDFHAVKLFPQQVKRTHPALEKCRLRFTLQPFQQDFRRGFITATLHDLSVPDRKTHLQIRMGRKDFLQCRPEPLRINTAELPGCWYIILQAVLMLFPIDIDTQLILGERIDLLPLISPDFLLSALQTVCPLPDTGCLQNILCFQRKPHHLPDSLRQADSPDRGQPHGQEIGRHAKIPGF